VIEVRDLVVRFGRTRAVDGVSFGAAAGESLALWGDNGAGKTTILRAVLGLLPHGGEIRLAGRDLRRDGRRARAQVGYVPQQLALYDDLTAIGYLRYVAGLRRQPAAAAAPLLARVGLADEAAKPVGALSGGMKQRLALAAALVGDPPVLVLDEPTASLDATARADFLRLLALLHASGKTMLVTSHRLEEVATLADRVLVLEGGRVRLACPASDLAAALRIEMTLRLLLAEGDVGPALGMLADRGYAARRNGHGVLVRVRAGERATPLRILTDGGIGVTDFTLEDSGWIER